MIAPNDTMPPFPMVMADDPTREYPIPSCGACMRVARRRGYNLGDILPDGIIEAFSHSSTGQVCAIVVAENGYFTTVVVA